MKRIIKACLLATIITSASLLVKESNLISVQAASEEEEFLQLLQENFLLKPTDKLQPYVEMEDFEDKIGLVDTYMNTAIAYAWNIDYLNSPNPEKNTLIKYFNNCQHYGNIVQKALGATKDIDVDFFLKDSVVPYTLFGEENHGIKIAYEMEKLMPKRYLITAVAYFSFDFGDGLEASQIPVNIFGLTFDADIVKNKFANVSIVEVFCEDVLKVNNYIAFVLDEVKVDWQMTGDYLLNLLMSINGAEYFISDEELFSMYPFQVCAISSKKVVNVTNGTSTWQKEIYGSQIESQKEAIDALCASLGNGIWNDKYDKIISYTSNDGTTLMPWYANNHSAYKMYDEVNITFERPLKAIISEVEGDTLRLPNNLDFERAVKIESITEQGAFMMHNDISSFCLLEPVKTESGTYTMPVTFKVGEYQFKQNIPYIIKGQNKSNDIEIVGARKFVKHRNDVLTTSEILKMYTANIKGEDITSSLIVSSDGYTGKGDKEGTYSVTLKASQGLKYNYKTISVVVSDREEFKDVLYYTDDVKPILQVKSTKQKTINDFIEIFKITNDIAKSKNWEITLLEDSYTADYNNEGIYDMALYLRATDGTEKEFTFQVEVVNAQEVIKPTTNKKKVTFWSVILNILKWPFVNVIWNACKTLWYVVKSIAVYFWKFIVGIFTFS